MQKQSTEGFDTLSKNLIHNLDQKVDSVSKFDKQMETMISETFQEIREKKKKGDGQGETLHMCNSNFDKSDSDSGFVFEANINLL